MPHRTPNRIPKWTKSPPLPSNLLDIRAVIRLIGLTRPTIWKMEKEGRFPIPLRLGKKRRLAWHARDICAWQASLPRTTPRSTRPSTPTTKKGLKE